MVNFKKIKSLVLQYETMPCLEQKRFFMDLKAICEIELNIRQAGLGEFFR